jgi:MoxR-like ATPase
VLVDPVPDDGIGELLDRGWDFEMERLDAWKREASGAAASVVPLLREAAVRALHQHIGEVKLSDARPHYEQILRDARAEGIELSDRRMVKGLKLIAGAALLSGRDEATPEDLWPLRHVWSKPGDAPILARVVDARIAEASGGAPLRSRTQKEMRLDLEMLEERERGLRGETSISAHLMALNRLRREVLLDFPDERSLRERVDEAVRRVLARLEEG